MPSEKFRITTNGQSLRNPNNAFFGMTLSANMTLDESDTSAHNDRRSAHNALERQRREHLNVKFQQLAHALPSLQTVRRPSKTMIVAKSLEFVSSSLKRENTFLSEIQKLRLENEKLKKQAQNSSQQLKRRLSRDNEEEKVDEKKKSSTDSQQQQQLSPPPTPEASKQQDNTQPPKKKQRMVKQTKSSSLQSQLHVVKKEPSTTTATTTTTTTMNTSSPWSPLLDETLNSTQQYPTSNSTLSPPNYFEINHSNTTSPINHNDLLFLTPTSIDMYSNMQQQSQYHNMMNPMLLSPYFVPSNEQHAEVSYTTTSTSTAADNFYLS